MSTLNKIELVAMFRSRNNAKLQALLLKFILEDTDVLHVVGVHCTFKCELKKKPTN